MLSATPIIAALAWKGGIGHRRAWVRVHAGRVGRPAPISTPPKGVWLSPPIETSYRGPFAGTVIKMFSRMNAEHRREHKGRIMNLSEMRVHVDLPSCLEAGAELDQQQTRPHRPTAERLRTRDDSVECTSREELNRNYVPMLVLGGIFRVRSIGRHAKPRAVANQHCPGPRSNGR